RRAAGASMRYLLIFAFMGWGCANEAKVDSAQPLPDAGGDATPDSEAKQGGVEVTVDVPESGRALVDLDAEGGAVLGDDAASSIEWDLAFSGRDVLTNSGPSGLG